MKYLTLIFCFLISLTLSAQLKIKNPLNIKFGDPFIIYDKVSDKYYMYGTGGVHNGFKAYSSDDLVAWKDEGTVYSSAQEKAWGTKDFWAPEVYIMRGKYYMFYSAHWKNNPNNELENYKIGIAVADKPSGPFIDLTGKPLFAPGYPVIDANVYFADDGRMFLYFSRCCYKHPVESEISVWAKKQNLFNEIEESWVYGVELKSDFSGVTGKPTLLLRPPVKMNNKQSEWESRSVTQREVNRRWTEGSFLVREKDRYYIMYSANYFGGRNYAVGYATSQSPMGPFTKSPDNPILEKNTDKGGNVSGTGHNMVFKDREGRMLCVYHGRTTETGDDRIVFIREIKVSAGKILIVAD